MTGDGVGKVVWFGGDGGGRKYVEAGGEEGGCGGGFSDGLLDELLFVGGLIEHCGGGF